MSMNIASYADLLVMLAAKDAEIAELRARPTMELLSELLRGLEMPSLAAAAAPSQLYAIGVAIADQAKRCAAAERERDEARECVRRLYAALQPFANIVPIEPTGLITGLMREDFSNAVSALAATPEHLQ